MENLKDMEKGDAKELPMPWDNKSTMLINCLGPDCYQGHIARDSKIQHQFELCSIPQLSAHLLSHFELYDEAANEGLPNQQEESSSRLSPDQSQVPQETNQPNVEESYVPKNEESSSYVEYQHVRQHLRVLESKINALIMLAVKEPMQKNTAALNKAVKSLTKTGIMPKMPSPGQPGVRSGSKEGIAQTGFHSPKTAASDLNTKEHYDVKNPNLKTGSKLTAQAGLPQQPQQPKAPKMSFKMSENGKDSKCLDCGEPDFHQGKYQRCACFKTMSEPKIKKSENGTVVMTFAPDWEFEDRLSLWVSLAKNRKD
jgi:hypothetical protein